MPAVQAATCINKFLYRLLFSIININNIRRENRKNMLKPIAIQIVECYLPEIWISVKYDYEFANSFKFMRDVQGFLATRWAHTLNVCVCV